MSTRIFCGEIRKLSIFIRQIIFLFLHENICCGYTSEAPQLDTFNEYP